MFQEKPKMQKRALWPNARRPSSNQSTICYNMENDDFVMNV